MKLCKLSFKNRDAFIRKVSFHVEEHAVDNILAWYAAHHAGDDYTVKLDGVKLKLDFNGERV